ncbi:MAG: hypothetical protein BroJett013_16080 [Alphaproteobacteria bacterium]|nr:MAG: hypothetical protein BroJett013_16080 [Alphaproteobacteria bacterium]
MTGEPFRDLWWLVFPLFGMAMAVFGLVRDSRAQDAVIRRARERLQRGQ